MSSTEKEDFTEGSFLSINGETFNVGGGKDISVSLKELTALCELHTGNTIKINNVADNRPNDIRLYITDNSKVTEKTGWTPQIKPSAIIEEITHWIKDNEAILKPILY